MKSKIYPLFIAILVLFFTTSCHRYYTNAKFEELSNKHKTVAVLPASVILTGNKPKKMTDADIAKQEFAESYSFQESLYNNILTNGTTRKYETTIALQPIEKTRELLKSNSIDFKDINSVSDEVLCQKLGVDAIVRLKIMKTRYMSGLVSFGADVLSDILLGNVGVFIPGTTTITPSTNTKTNDITADCSIQSNGIILWNDNYTAQANWQLQPNEIIGNLTNSFAKHFPYRKKKA